MTFSSRIKNELTRTSLNQMCCVQAELAALIRTTGYINFKSFGKLQIEFTTENAAVARRIFKLLKLRYGISNEVSMKKSNRLKKHNNYTVTVDDNCVSGLLKDTGLGENRNILEFDFGVPIRLLNKECCRRAYIRGAFMGCGSINDPEKSYHAEFVNSNEEHASGLVELMKNYDLNAKIIGRKEHFITYIKESENIVDLMNVMGAHSALLDFENVRAVKETRNNINRVINCETANLDKIVDTSLRQINCIKVLKKHKVMDKLPDNLKDLAYLRLKHSNASLKELGEMLTPPLGKSGVNHRLKKIEQIAEDLLDYEKRGVEDEIAKGNIEKQSRAPRQTGGGVRKESQKL